MMNATIITIGDELLIGQTIDTNSAWISQQLNKLGIEVLRRVAIGDTRNAIIGALDEEITKGDILLITGGLGPTSDDITKPLLCEYFGGELRSDERVLEHIKTIFARNNRLINERNIKQAEVPTSCVTLFNRFGTAPGMWFNKDSKIVIAMPGVPYEMMVIMEDEVLPRLTKEIENRSKDGSINHILHYSIVTAGEAESAIAEKLVDLETQLPSFIKLAYLPDASVVKLRLTGSGTDRSILVNTLEHFQLRIAELLGNIVVALEDIPIEEILGRALRNMDKSLGTAESCTGGLIGHNITQIPGASEYYTGGIICYSNNVKQSVLKVKKSTLDNFGAVSKETVTEMVMGVMSELKADYAIAVSGVLGPAGGTERVKVGTVWMAVANKDSVVTREFYFRFDRKRNKEIAARNAIIFLLKFVTGKI